MGHGKSIALPDDVVRRAASVSSCQTIHRTGFILRKRLGVLAMKRVLWAAISLIATIGIAHATGVPVPSSSMAQISGSPGAFSPTGGDILYDQSGNPGLNSTSSQDFEAANDPFDNQAADDFVVPAGETWTITSVDAQGAYFNGVGPADSYNVYFYADAAGLPGAEVESQMALTYTDPSGLGSPSIPLAAPVVLTEGTYWVSVQASLNFSVGGQWGWLSST